MTTTDYEAVPAVAGYAKDAPQAPVVEAAPAGRA
jgi:hypothetical protein